MLSQSYSDTANTLVNRILQLIPSHPEILNMDNPFSLFKIDGFRCDDLSPSFFQASWALSRAKSLYKGEKK